METNHCTVGDPIVNKRTRGAKLQAPDPRVLDHEVVRVAEAVDRPAAVVLPHVDNENLELAAVRHLKRALREMESEERERESTVVNRRVERAEEISRLSTVTNGCDS